MGHKLAMEEVLARVEAQGWRFLGLNHIRNDDLWSCVLERTRRDDIGVKPHACAMDLSAELAMNAALDRAEAIDAATPPKKRDARGLPPDDKPGLPLIPAGLEKRLVAAIDKLAFRTLADCGEIPF